MTATHSERQSRRRGSEALRMTLGITGFAWAALILLMRYRAVAPAPFWPVYLLGGAAFGAVATRATRHAGQRALGRVLVVLGVLALGAIVAAVLLHPGGDVYIGFMPMESFLALTLLPLPLWLLVSSRKRASE